MGLTLGMQGDLAGSGAWAPVLLWLISPVVAWWISVPLSACEVDLHDDQRLFLRTSVRRTWCFFDDFVGPEDHWLPPDNVQEYPAVVIASRTSPTNIGMGLLAKPPVVVRPPE